MDSWCFIYQQVISSICLKQTCKKGFFNTQVSNPFPSNSTLEYCYFTFSYLTLFYFSINIFILSTCRKDIYVYHSSKNIIRCKWFFPLINKGLNKLFHELYSARTWIRRASKCHTFGEWIIFYLECFFNYKNIEFLIRFLNVLYIANDTLFNESDVLREGIAIYPKG